jgi:uncharacterized protein with HEPN domain
VKHGDDVRLRYASESIEYVFEWTAEGREHFFRDRTLRDAVLYRLQTLTQALRDLTPAVKRRHPDVPFSALAGFRNVLVHDFLGLKLELIWDVIETHLPHLQPQVSRMLADLDRPHS